MEENNEDIEFKNLIHIIRGQQVMLDSDLAELYGYEVSQFNRQVKRNAKRFPNDFMFKLNKSEYVEILKCQFGISSSYGGRRSTPYVFTEQGIYMLAAVLKGEIAEKQSIYIIREFKRMRHYLAENKSLLNNEHMLIITNRLAKHEEDIQNIENKLEIFATKSDIDKVMDNFINKDKIKEKLFLDG